MLRFDEKEASRLTGDIGHECGFAFLRLLKPMDYYIEKYGTCFYGLQKMYLLLEKQRNRGQDGAGLANLKMNPQQGQRYIHRDRVSVTHDSIRELFKRVMEQAEGALETAGLGGLEPDQMDSEILKMKVPYTGECFLGHVRYGTDSLNSYRECHPVMRSSNWMSRSLLVAGNFNITNTEELFRSLVELGQHPVELSDTVTLLEKIGHYLDKENNDLIVKYSAAGHPPRECMKLVGANINLIKVLRKALDRIDGGYALTGLLGHGDAFVVRDPNGIRPAFYYHDDEIVVVASEAPLIRSVFGVDKVDSVPAGAALIVKASGQVSVECVLPAAAKLSQCSFERIYFSRGNDADVYRERERLGRLLATRTLERVGEVGGTFKNTVFSFIPNTSEFAFYGMVKQLREDLYREQRKAMETGTNLGVIDLEVREEKVVHKDAKLRTFIQEDSSRKAMTMHAYDVHYGTVKEGEVLVALDDSIVRGNTLKNAILKTLERLRPSSIVIVSSAPMICYPDPYGIDMAKLADFVAFKAAIALLRSRGKEGIIEEVYEQCLQDAESDVNYVKRIYEDFTQRELEDKIAEIIQPENCKARVEVVFQTVGKLHEAIPEHLGDWYFTGNYPTLGGAVVCKRAFTLWMEGRGDERCYGVSSGGGTNVLVVGSGGREHALATAIAASHKVKRVYVAPGNAGEHEKIMNIPASNASKDAIVAYCRKKHISLVVIGPEQPLVEGVGDVLQSAGIPVFGPTAAAAEIEGSKAWAKGFMRRHDIPTAEFVTATTLEEGEKAVEKICSDGGGVVVKASGLAAGKGVIVVDTVEQGKEALREIFRLYGGPVVVEELMEGPEVSVFALTNGRNFVVLPPARDHKRVFNDDGGPNTGGMGAFVTNSLLAKSEMQDIKERIVGPSIEGLAGEGRAFTGCLYIGLMMTSNGPKVLEYNCRFGDPETQALLPLLVSNKIDCYDLFLSCTAAGKQLSSKLSARLDAIKGSSVTVVLASRGYPGGFTKGHPINGVNRAECVPGVHVYYAGAQFDEKRVVVTSGGRVLSVTAGGETVRDAAERAYCAVRSITFEGVHYRTDIAASFSPHRSKSLSESGSDTPRSLRSGITYLAAGVDIQAGEAAVDGFKPLVKRTQRPGMGGSLGDFGGFCDLSECGSYKEPVLVSGTDGVGTKLKVANLIGKHDTVGIDLVAMCVNDVVVHGAEPLFFLDYFAVGKLDVKQAVEVVKGIADGCVQAGCTLLGGETAELPGLFANAAEYDIAGFVVGVKEKALKLPDKDSMQHGDVLIGLLSSGVHSNGFSLVRKIAEISGVKMTDPAPYDPTTTLGVSLLTPTKIYVKTILELVRLGPGILKGAAHITGGGLFQNIPRMLPESVQAVIRADTWDLPAVFRWCVTQGKLDCTELASTFNVGIGMVLCVGIEHKEEVMRVLKGLDEEAVVIGELVDRPTLTDPRVVVVGAETEWTLLSDLGVNPMLKPSVLSGLFDEESSPRSSQVSGAE